MAEQLPDASETSITFCGKSLSDLTDSDFASEAVDRLGLLKRSAVENKAAMFESVATEHPRAITTRYRKAGQQVTPELKKGLKVRANAYLSVAAYDELTDAGKLRPLEAHEITLLRAVFHKLKAETLGNALNAGFETVRFSPGHLDECAYCQENNNSLLYISEVSELPISGCSREACSALIHPYRDYLRKRNAP